MYRSTEHYGSLDRPDVEVLYDTQPGAVLALLAAAFIRRDPLRRIPRDGGALATLPDPQGTSVVHVDKDNASVSDMLIDVLYDPTASKGDTESLKKALGNYVYAIQSLTLHSITPARALRPSELRASAPEHPFLKALDAWGDQLAKGTAITGHQYGDPGLDTDKTIYDVGSALDGSAALSNLLINLSFERVLTSKLFELQRPDSPTTEEGRYQAMAKRIMYLVVMARAIRAQAGLLRLRPVLRWLQSPPSVYEMSYVYDKDELDEFNTRAKRVLDQPVHPWIATAERLTLPSRRGTAWGTNVAMGLDRALLAALVDGGKAKRGVKGMNPSNLYPWARRVVYNTCRELDWMEERGLAQVHTALGFTKPGSPAAVRLSGRDIQFVYTGGLNTSAPIRDFIDLLLSPHLYCRTPNCVRGAGADPWEGTLSLKVYREEAGNAKGVAELSTLMDVVNPKLIAIGTGEDLKLDSTSVRLAIEPEVFDVGAPELIKREDPRMIQPASQYMGEDDALTIPCTPDAVAQLMTQPGEAVRSGIMQEPGEWAHLFGAKDSAGNFPSKDSHAFISERTRRPWLGYVHIPVDARATTQIGLVRGLGRLAMPVIARIERDWEPAVAAYPQAPASETLIKLATE